MKNRIADLRNHLFETLEALKDKDQPMEIERAKAISDVAQTVINSAKVELQFLELVGEDNRVPFFGQPQLPTASTNDPHRVGRGSPGNPDVTK